MFRKIKVFPASAVAVHALVLLGGPAIAGEIVTLSGGSRLEAEAVANDGKRVIITLAGGGEISLPVERVLRVERFQTIPQPATPIPESPAVPNDGPGVAGPPAAGSAVDPPRFSPSNPEPSIRSLIAYLSSPAGVDARLVEALVRVESNFDPYAVSRKGAMGLMQLMPGTASRYEVSRPFEPEQNLRAGIAYLKDLLDRYGKVELALAAYNAGEEAVDRHGGIPPYRETRAYVRRILKILQS